MKKNIRSFIKKVFFVSAVFVFASCSSAPKRTMERTEIADDAYTHLETANRALAKGDLITARTDLSTAYSMALSVDNAELLTKICLSKISFELNANTDAEERIKAADENLLEAKNYSQRCTDIILYSSLCSLYESRLYLEKKQYDKAVEILNEIEINFKKNPEYQAYLFRTRGEIFLEQKNYESSQQEFNKAAEIHIKERYLSEIALDYYYLARAFSRGGNKALAKNALESALKYDRLDENTSGIGADYYALAVVLMSGNPDKEEKAAARQYALYSAKVFAAGGFEQLAVRSEEFAEKISD